MGGGTWGSMEGPGGPASLHDGKLELNGHDDSPPEGMPKKGRPWTEKEKPDNTKDGESDGVKTEEK